MFCEWCPFIIPTLWILSVEIYYAYVTKLNYLVIAIFGSMRHVVYLWTLVVEWNEMLKVI